MGATNGYSSVEPNEEQQQPSSPTETECRVCLVRFTAVISVVSILGAAWMFYVNQTYDQVPHYSLSIDSVSGLDPATDLGQKPTLHPEFNLTLRVASHGLWVSECADPSIYVEVFYRGYKLAASATLIHQICAWPRGEVEHPIIARGSGVVVPGPELDSLAMDMRSGVPEFNVKLCDPKAVWCSCGPRTVGDAGALGKECDRFSFD